MIAPIDTAAPDTVETRALPPVVAVYSVLFLVQCTAAAGLVTLYAALGALFAEFDGGAIDIGWTVTAYLVAAAIASALCGRLADVYGPRKVMLMVLAIALVGALISILSRSAELMILGCLLQGAAGALTPLAVSLARTSLTPSRVPVAVGAILAIGASSAGVLLFGAGWFVDHFASQGAFVFKSILTVLSFISVALIIPKTSRTLKGPLGIVRGVLFVPGLVCVLIAIDMSKAWGLADMRTLGAVAAGLAALGAWAWDQSRMTAPLIDVRLLARRPIALALSAYFILCLGGAHVMQMLPLLWQQPSATGVGFGLSATLSGLVFMFIQPASLISAPLSGVAARRHGARIVAIIGAVVLAAGWLGLTLAYHNFVASVGFTIMIILALGIVQPSILNIVVEEAPVSQTGEAAGIAFVSYMVAMAVGSRVLFAITGASRTTLESTGVSYPTGSAFTLSFAFIIITCVMLIPLLIVTPSRTSSVKS